MRNTHESQNAPKSPTKKPLIFGAHPDQKGILVCERRRREQKKFEDLEIKYAENPSKMHKSNPPQEEFWGGLPQEGNPPHRNFGGGYHKKVTPPKRKFGGGYR